VIEVLEAGLQRSPKKNYLKMQAEFVVNKLQFAICASFETGADKKKRSSLSDRKLTACLIAYAIEINLRLVCDLGRKIFFLNDKLVWETRPAGRKSSVN
jgi:hypothetical protein